MINSQPHKMSCGPVAICNALRWLNRRGSYRYILDLCAKYSDFSFDHGMRRPGVCGILRHLGVRHRVKLGVTMKDIDRELDNGNAVILQFQCHFNGGCHYTLIEGYSRLFYKAWNAGGTDQARRDRKYFAKWFRYAYGKHGSYLPNMIVLRRN